MNRVYPYGKKDGNISFESVHDGSECTGNTGIIINFNIVVDKDTDVRKVKAIVRGLMFERPRKELLIER